MEHKLVSVIIPAYNTGKYIKTAINSVLHQSYDNIEIIVVDDGSTDDTADIAESLLVGTHSNWRIIRSSNGGVSSARNIGISSAHGEWIICIDSDDYFAPEMIERLYEAAVSNDADCAFSDYKMVNDSTLESRPSHDDGVQVYSRDEIKKINLRRTIKWVIPATLYKNEIAKLISFDLECPYSEDTLYTWELIYKINKVAYVNVDMYNYYRRTGSKQRSQTAEKCLKSIACYKSMIERLLEENASDSDFIRLITPKFALGAYHVLARCTDYSTFSLARKQFILSELNPIYRSGDYKLIAYMLLFKYTPHFFHKISQ